MTKKSIAAKQAKEFLELQQSFGEVKQKLIHLYVKNNYDSKFLQACVNLDEFQLTITQDFLTYSSKDTEKNSDEFSNSIGFIKNYLKNFSNVYENNSIIS